MASTSNPSNSYLGASPCDASSLFQHTFQLALASTSRRSSRFQSSLLKSTPAECSVSFANAHSSSTSSTIPTTESHRSWELTSPVPSLTTLASTSSLSLATLATPTSTTNHLTSGRRRRKPVSRISSEDLQIDVPMGSLLFADTRPHGPVGDSEPYGQIEIFAVDDPALSSSPEMDTDESRTVCAAHEIFCEKFQDAWKLRTGNGILVPAPLDPPLPLPRCQRPEDLTPLPDFGWDMEDLTSLTPYPPLHRQRGFDAPSRSASPPLPVSKRHYAPPSGLSELMWIHRDDASTDSAIASPAAVTVDERVVLRMKKTRNEKMKKRTRRREVVHD
ncbi:hypothetical protein DL96DRAFT_1561728 [Flagelloscypha sp. PMI_526]|nr:hypothetical protein DL96DRAFT_1561728 [Flagelloscypha sp. PMI_526]